MNQTSRRTVSIIPNQQDYVKRPRIHHLLEESLKRPVTTIVAGAGYGKTQAVYEYLQECDAITIWLQLSQFDNLPTRLWESFIYAVSLQNEELAFECKSVGFPETMQEYGRFLVVLANAIKEDKRHVLVYDDFHLISEPSVLKFFENFINTQIPNLSIIIISREEPGINTIGLLSKNMLSVADENALRFSKEEMMHYFKVQNIHLSEKTISKIYNYTEGWIFAILLVGFSLKKGDVSEDYAITAAKQNVFRLIENEALTIISNELLLFLIKLSLIDHLPLELLEELASHNKALIKEMAKLSSFVRYDAFLNEYRIHQLFLDFLRDKQSVLSTKDTIDTYTKAADWYAGNGYSVDALTYYEKAGRYDKLLQIALTFYVFCSEEIGKYVLAIMDRMPKNIYEEKPFALVMHAKLTMNCYRFEDAYWEAARIVEKFESLPLTEENKTILGESNIILGLADFVRCAYTGEYLFEKHFKRADDYLPNGSALFNKSNFLLNVGNYSCMVGRPVKGEFDKFTNAICNTMPYAARVTNGSGLGTEYLCLAEKSYFQGDLQNVKKYANQAIDESRKQEQYTVEGLATYYLVKTYVSSGDYTKIISLLNQLKAICEKYNTSTSYKILDITEGWFYAQIKQPDKIADWIRLEMGSLNEVTTPIDYILGRLIRANCYLAEQKYYELLYFLDRYEELFGLNLFLLGSIEKKAIKAVALYQTKEVEGAIAVLQDAYDLAAPDGLCMPFVEMGGKMRSLVKAAMSHKNCAIPKQWLAMIATKASSYAKRVSKIITEYRVANHMEDIIRADFTLRELKILSGLCHGLSREEIAIDLGLSVNTVKNMLQIIFEKLGAMNTVDAVRIATLTKLVE